ncbi:MAG: glycosyltransferase family 4 protein [Candidatus Aminicenantes bacterium]|nr:glycosyltransferase family 4 protein [Candidatus Aminicenantes bacterium]
MKVAYVTPGSGSRFYCQNCFRDTALLQSLVSIGHDVVKVPMYLPSGLDNDPNVVDTPVFYGAVNVFLKEKLPFYRHVPEWIERILDSPVLLHLAAKKSGSTCPTGLEEMTLSMLQGEKGHQASELDHLIQHLRNEIAPDIVHLSNALLLGLAHRLKNDLGAGVVCSLQDENEWVDLMDEHYQSQVWNLMAEKAVDVDLFVTASQFYSNQSQKQMRIPADKIKVIYGGIDFNGYERSPLPFDPPVIGYLCRMSEYFGLGILVDAFIELKKESRFRDLRLYLTGGYSSDDKPFVNRLMKKISEHGLAEDVRVFKDFCKDSRIKFLKSLTLLSVPVPTGEAFGAYQVEALAAGVPIVQPNVGCYPEFIETTKGGVIYEPNTGEKLADAIASVLSDQEKVKKLGEQGRRVVLERFSVDQMAKNIEGIYNDVART